MCVVVCFYCGAIVRYNEKDCRDFNKHHKGRHRFLRTKNSYCDRERCIERYHRYESILENMVYSLSHETK